MALVPPYLKPKDLVLIIASARARDEKAIRPAIETIESWGLKVEVGRHAFKVHHQFAGTDSERIEDLQWAVSHPTAKAIIMNGGGYGTLRIIDHVNFSPLLKHPKWLVGYSDATVLHSRLLAMGIACIHGTMAFQFPLNQTATCSVHDLLFGKPPEYSVARNPLNRDGIANAELVGGNLSLLYALSGSRDELKTRNKILFIEDIDEQLYHLDRMMLHLRRGNKLGQLAGLIVGGMTEMKDNNIPFGKTAQEIIREAVEEYSYPICFDFPAGHVEENLAIFLGRKAKLLVESSNVKLSYLSDVL